MIAFSPAFLTVEKEEEKGDQSEGPGTVCLLKEQVCK
jgi:hypothetical protein